MKTVERSRRCLCFRGLAAFAFSAWLPAQAGDYARWGYGQTGNQVSQESGLPDRFDPETGLNILWSARLGTEAHATPVIAKGRVFVGTNNNEPRDPKHQGDRGVLMCFDQRDGSLLWQLVVPKRTEDRYFDWPNSGISSPATIEGDRVYIVTNRGEVACLDAKGLADGNDGPFQDEARHMTPAESAPLELGPLDADILWLFDLTEGAGIWSHDGAHSSILIHGDHLYLNTGTGVDNSHRRIRRPDAPSLVVLDKRTGRLLARDREGIGPNIFHCTWSAPTLLKTGRDSTLLFAAGDGVVYGFEPLSQDAGFAGVKALKKRWQFDFDPEAPKENVHLYHQNKKNGPSNFYGMPVAADGRFYVAGGGDLWWGKNGAWLKCVDRERGADPLVWSYPLGRHVMATPAVYEGLVFIADTSRVIHCVERATGTPLWTHEANGPFWASPYVADGKVYIGTRRGEFLVFAAQREKKILHRVDVGAPVSATAVAANETLYVATMFRLYAIRSNSPQRKLSVNHGEMGSRLDFRQTVDLL